MSDAARRILVLGGTGFVGQTLLAALRDGGERFAWTARIGSLPVDFPGMPAPILYDDLETLDLELIRSVDVIVDLVSRGRGRLSTARDITSRIRAHARLIDDLANRHWSGEYIYLSSGGTVYGVAPPPVCEETMPVAPFGDYALEKAFLELHLQSVAWQTGMALSILRVANAYGESQPAKPGFGVIPAIVSAIAEEKPFTLYGTGMSRRDYVHVDDIVAAIFAAMARPNAGIVNIGSGVGTSVRDLLARTEAATGRPVRIEPVHTLAPEPQSTVLDIRRARERLGWEARIGLECGLKRVLAHHGLVPDGACRTTALVA